jgi:glycosyltransferase involved in cell wall biosynthesis
MNNNPGKIKICYVASVDTTFKFILLSHLKFLKKEGYDVYGVCSEGKWIKKIEEEGIKMRTIRIKRKISPISDVVAFWKLYFYFKKEKFHIVHAHTLKPAVWAQMAARAAGIPIVINTIHGFDFSQESSFLKRSFFIFLEKIASRQSDLIFAVSKKIIEDSVKIGICKKNTIKYLGDGIDVFKFDPYKFSEKFIMEKKNKLKIDPKKKVVGIMARLVEEKGYLDLFSAFSMIIKKFPETLLLAAGHKEPEKKDAIKEDVVKKYGIENNVIFLGERSDAEELYPIMDVFVLPSHREGLGIATLEASAMEKPVIVSNVGGCPETVENGKTGILVSVKDPNELSKAIIYIFENPEKAQKMGKEGRKKIIREFDENLVFERLVEEYKRLINEKLK